MMGLEASDSVGERAILERPNTTSQVALTRGIRWVREVMQMLTALALAAVIAVTVKVTIRVKRKK